MYGLLASVCFFLVVGFLSIKAQDDKLLQLAIVFRHGDRTPETTYPNDPYNDILFKDDDPGQLTNAGKKRQFELGQWLRKRYDHFLTDKYDHKQVSVVSDDSDRCLMSSASNLAGLFPPKDKQIWNPHLNWQPIPIHINSFLFSVPPANCPAFDKHFNNLLTSTWYQNANRYYKDLYDYVSNFTGKPIKGFYDLEQIRDILYIESLLNLPLPSWTDNIFPGIMDDVAALNFGLFSNTTVIRKFIVGRVFDEILNNFEHSNKKLYMYSGHATNVGLIMSTLRPSQKQFCPYFAATIIFELWQRGDRKIIKVIFKNNDDVEVVHIEGCGTECSLKDFKELYKDIIISPEQYHADCNAH